MIGTSRTASIAQVHRGASPRRVGVAKRNTTSRNPTVQTLKSRRYTMLTKTKIALATALIAGTASVASAQGVRPESRQPLSVLQCARRHGAALYRHVGAGFRIAQHRVAERRAARRTADPRRCACSPHRCACSRAVAPMPAASPAATALSRTRSASTCSDRASSPYAGGVN